MSLNRNDDKFHGQGTYTSSDGSKYEGEWKDGGNHGQGTLTFSDGTKKEVEYKDGVLLNEEIEEQEEEKVTINNASDEIVSKIKKLKELLEEGILTDEEYQKKKDELVSQI